MEHAATTQVLDYDIKDNTRVRRMFFWFRKDGHARDHYAYWYAARANNARAESYFIKGFKGIRLASSLQELIGNIDSLSVCLYLRDHGTPVSALDNHT